MEANIEKSHKNKYKQFIRWTARSLCVIIVVFALFMLIGSAIESAQKANAQSLTLSAILELTILALVCWGWY